MAGALRTGSRDEAEQEVEVGIQVFTRVSRLNDPIVPRKVFGRARLFSSLQGESPEYCGSAMREGCRFQDVYGVDNIHLYVCTVYIHIYTIYTYVYIYIYTL